MSKLEGTNSEPEKDAHDAHVRNKNVADLVVVEALHDNLEPLSEAKRFSIVSVAVFGSIAASFAHFFNLFSGELEKKYHLTQRDLSTVARWVPCSAILRCHTDLFMTTLAPCLFFALRRCSFRSVLS
ncbi:hypothetical protein TcBrA4_0066410 [Trypanosoma cruzi]|nr:hypothetical protein TcBrA4_0066410 [Trypanosoma cruzi]